MSETTLQRIARGDTSAARECLDRHGPLVWSLALRFCASREDAEDTVQEIFLELWASAGRYDPLRGCEATFVAMIARRRLIDGRRRSDRKPAAEPLPDDLAHPAPDTALLAERGDDARRARQALATLAEQPQRVLTMAIYGGYTQEEIAAATGMPLGTVKTHARRGLIRLREMLGFGSAGPSKGAKS